MKESKEYQIPIITVTVSVKPKGTTENLKSWTAQLCYGTDQNPGGTALTAFVPPDKDGVVVFKPNTTLPPTEKFYIDLRVTHPPFAVHHGEVIGRPQTNTCVCFVLVPVSKA